MAANSGATTSYVTTVWTIENLSCWNGDVHGNVIENPYQSHSGSTKIQICPSGATDEEDGDFLVRIFFSNTTGVFSGNLSIYNSTGVVYTQSVNSKTDSLFVEVPIGRKLELVQSCDDAKYHDKITLKFQIKSGRDEVHCMRTAVEVINASLKIPAELFKKCDLLFPVCISTIEYHENAMSLTIFHDDNSEISFALQPTYIGRSFVSITMKNNVRHSGTIDKSHLFRDRSKWVFSSSLSRVDFEKGLPLLLNVKIIPGNKYLHDSFDHGFERKEVRVHMFPVSNDPGPGTGISKVSIVHSDDSLDVLIQDFTRLFRDRDLSDFQLHCGDVTFPVHRAILSARSPVFKTMLSSDMRESATGAVDITDIDAPTVELFLSYLYTGIVNGLQWESALKLYDAADKYQVTSLKAKCTSVLDASVSIDNVCELLLLAEKHQDDHLSKIVHDFISGNYNPVVKSKKWKRFSKREPDLATKTLTLFW